MKFLLFIIIIGAIVGFIWHDDLKVWLDDFGKQAEEKAPEWISQGLQNSQAWWEAEGQTLTAEFVDKLSEQGKAKIDQWLEERNLNQYGDEPETLYTGGTPLFNEETGEVINRYVYLLKKFPELFKNLNLADYLK